MNDQRPRERFDSTTITTVIVLIALLVLLNWPFEYIATAFKYHHPNHLSDLTAEVFLFNHYEMITGGFPLTYIFREEDDPISKPQFWSSVYLAIDVLLGVLIVASAGVASYRINQRLERSHRNSDHRSPTSPMLMRIACGGPILACVLLPTAFTAWNERTKLKLIESLGQSAILVQYAIVPKPFIKSFPGAVLSRFAQIRGVTLVNASPKVLSEVYKLKTIRSLGFVGNLPDPSELAVFSEQNHLKQLSLQNGFIDAATKKVIEKLKKLRQLDLIACTGLEDGFDGIKEFQYLRHLNIANCDLQLSKVSTHQWPPSLESMTLSRPRSGCDSLEIRSLRNLKSLNVARSDYHLNSDLLEIKLHELPRLTHFVVETLQKMSIEIVTAPRLTTISYSEQELTSRQTTSEAVPVAPWLESLRLHELPSLRDLQFDGLDLKVLDISGVPNLQRIAIGRYGHSTGIILRESEDDPTDRMQAIINSLGSLDGPRKLELSSLPLSGIDFGPLENNRRLRELSLVRCGITGPQLSEIANVPNLTAIDIRLCPITDVEACSLLNRGLPLREVLVSSDRFERIEVTHQTTLRGFVTTDSPMAKVVNIQDSPELNAELVLGNCVNYLCIRDARSLQGLSINGPIPKNSELHGFRSLRFFAIGGPQATDQLCNYLWKCTDLDHLTIAYGRLSQKTLANVGKLKKLTVLSLPGSETDDSIVNDHWQDLEMLSDINLSDSAITSDSWEFLVGQKNLQKLAINHCQMNKDSLEKLVDVRQLIELEVAGIGLTPTTLRGCLRRGMLDRLDLSESEVTEEMVDILASNVTKSIMFLGLQKCGLSDQQIRRIAEAHPRLALDVSKNPISDQLVSVLKDQKRFIDRRDRDSFLRHLSTGGGLKAMADIKAEYDQVRGRINHHQFAVRRP